MPKWYEDKTMLQTMRDCDEAYYSNDIAQMKALSEKCYLEGHNDNNSNLLQARYLYSSLTSLNDWIAASIKKEMEEGKYLSKIDGIRAYEEEYESSYYLIRTAFDICDEARKSISTMDEIEKAHFYGLYLPMVVNYANLLSQTGRIVKSIELLDKFSHIDFPMILGNLGAKLLDYVYFDCDDSHKKIIAYKAYYYFKKATTSKKAYPEKNQVYTAFQNSMRFIEEQLGQDYLKETYTLNDFLYGHGKMSNKEKAYRVWISSNGLALNTLNDVFKTHEVGYDPLHLPNLVAKVEDGIIPHFHGLFNQIKQEFVSARYFAYDGLIGRHSHFSDKGVYLVNTLDYPVYGLSIEKVKAAYRGVYSIFDKIAYFLNEYYGLGIKKREIDNNRLWNPKNDDKKTIFNYIESNYPLSGMWWLYKDIKNKNISKTDKHIDPIVSKITTVRNAMEHRYLKVLDFFFDDPSLAEERTDRLADAIAFEDFEKLTISLLKYAREAIMLLVMSVFVEEHNREKNRNPDEIIPPMLTSEYMDEWKQIF